MSTTDTERDERLRGIQERAAAATEGPWSVDGPAQPGPDERPQDFVGRLIEHERIERLGEARLAADHLCDGRDTLGLPERAKAVVLALDAEVTRLDAVVTAQAETIRIYERRIASAESYDGWDL